ncbi:MAG: heparinase II/III family protein [Clostridia bacterium]|nr:heparinase II/III family protein [Clostridia bacterium]
MEPIFTRFIPETSSLLLPAEDVRMYGDLPAAEYVYPDAVSKAEALLGQPIPALPASLYRQYYENGNRSNYESLYFARRHAMLLLAAAEKTEGKGRFLDLLVDYIWAICEESTWVIPAHNNSRHGRRERLVDHFDLGEGDDVHYIDLFSAATGANIAMVYHLLHEELDALTPVITRRMLGLLDRRIFHPFLCYQDTMWWKGSQGQVLNNWTPWIISNVLTALLLCETDSSRRIEIVRESMVILDRFILFYKSDGGCDEGPGYWGVAGASYFDCLELLWDLSGGKIDVFGDPLIRRMGEYIADVHITGDLYVNFADASHRLGGNSALIARYGRRTASPKLTAFAIELSDRNTDARALDVGNGSTVYRAFRDPIEPMPEPMAVKPESRTYYDGLEIFIARDENSGLCLAAKGGSNAESHNHNDVGNIVLFRGEHPVFIDAGVEQYTQKTFSAERYTLWTMRSCYHNLPDIGGREQKPGDIYRAALEVHTEDSVTYDLTAAWPSDTGIIRYTRESAMTGSAVTVTDTLKLTNSREVCWYWMCAEKPEIDGNTLYFADAGCRVKFTGSDFRLTAEEFPLTDGKLLREWRVNSLWRIHLSAEMWTDGIMKMEVLPE